MIKRGGTAAEAKKLADEFQALVLDVMFESASIKEENDIIGAKALPGTKKKEPAKLPNEFVTNDDFCPGCGLELKSLPIERDEPLDRRVPARSADGFDPRMQSVRAAEAGPARVPRLGPRAAAERRSARATSTACATTSKTLRKAQPPKYPFVHGVGDVEKPVDLKVSMRGNPLQSRRRGAAPLPLGARGRRRRRRSRRAAAAWSWPTPS